MTALRISHLRRFGFTAAQAELLADFIFGEGRS